MMGALAEGIYQRIGDLGEYRADHHGDDTVGKSKIQLQFNLARGIRQCGKRPVTRQALEWTFDQLHVDTLSWHQAIAGGEALVQFAFLHLDPGLHAGLIFG